MTALTIPTELAAVYVALGWHLVHEGCCGLAYVMPPVHVMPARPPRWRTSR
jgi:hypothetical protein